MPPPAPRRPCLACVVEKSLNLGGHGGHDGAVEQQIQSAEQECADNYSDENLYAGIDITLSLLGSDGRLSSSNHGINLVSDFLKHILLPLVALFLFQKSCDYLPLVYLFVSNKCGFGSITQRANN